MSKPAVNTFSTPGPWQVAGPFTVVADGGEVVASCPGPSKAANARLIAATPDVCEALAALVVEVVSRHVFSPEALDGPHTCSLCAAVEKARAALVQIAIPEGEIQ